MSLTALAPCPASPDNSPWQAIVFLMPDIKSIACRDMLVAVALVQVRRVIVSHCLAENVRCSPELAGDHFGDVTFTIMGSRRIWRNWASLFASYFPRRIRSMGMMFARTSASMCPTPKSMRMCRMTRLSTSKWASTRRPEKLRGNHRVFQRYSLEHIPSFCCFGGTRVHACRTNLSKLGAAT